MRKPFAAGCMLLMSSATFAELDEDARHHHDLQEPTAAATPSSPIEITINPEARLTARLAASLPQAAPCGTSTTLPISIVNQGFVTARLQAAIVGSASDNAVLSLHAEPLKGMPEEVRGLEIMLLRPGPTDITIFFRTGSDVSDPGGRDRVHLLMDCRFYPQLQDPARSAPLERAM